MATSTSGGGGGSGGGASTEEAALALIRDAQLKQAAAMPVSERANTLAAMHLREQVFSSGYQKSAEEKALLDAVSTKRVYSMAAGGAVAAALLYFLPRPRGTQFFRGLAAVSGGLFVASWSARSIHKQAFEAYIGLPTSEAARDMRHVYRALAPGLPALRAFDQKYPGRDGPAPTLHQLAEVLRVPVALLERDAASAAYQPAPAAREAGTAPAPAQPRYRDDGASSGYGAASVGIRHDDDDDDGRVHLLPPIEDSDSAYSNVGDDDGGGGGGGGGGGDAAFPRLAVRQEHDLDSGTPRWRDDASGSFGADSYGSGGSYGGGGGGGTPGQGVASGGSAWDRVRQNASGGGSGGGSNGSGGGSAWDRIRARAADADGGARK